MLTTFRIIGEKEFQCEFCLSKRTTPEQLQKIREFKGCFGDSRAGYKLEHFKIKGCVGNYFSPAVFYWYRNFKNFQRGILPFAGTLLEQPAKAIEVFQLFESFEVKRAVEEEEREAKRRKSEGSSNGR